MAQHPGHIGPGFGDIGDGVLDPARAGVVGGQAEGHVAVVAVEQGAQVPGATGEVFERVGHPKFPGGGRHELHQAQGTLGGHGFGIEVGFRLDHRLDEQWIDPVFGGNRLDGVLQRIGGRVIFRPCYCRLRRCARSAGQGVRQWSSRRACSLVGVAGPGRHIMDCSVPVHGGTDRGRRLGRPEEGGDEQEDRKKKASRQSLARLPAGTTPPLPGRPLTFC